MNNIAHSTYFLPQRMNAGSILESTKNLTTKGFNEPEYESLLNENLDFAERLQQLANSGKLNTSKMSVKTKFEKKSTDILKNWLLKNIDHPYPSDEVKEKLCQMTGLNKKQIQNWFINTRKRYVQPLKKKIDHQNEAQGIKAALSDDTKSPNLDGETSTGSGSQTKQEDSSCQSKASQEINLLQQVKLPLGTPKVTESTVPLMPLQNWSVPSLNIHQSQASLPYIPQNMGVVSSNTSLSSPLSTPLASELLYTQALSQQMPLAVNPYAHFKSQSNIQQGLLPSMTGRFTPSIHSERSLLSTPQNMYLNMQTMQTPPIRLQEPALMDSVNATLKLTLQNMREEKMRQLSNLAYLNETNSKLINIQRKQSLDAYMHPLMKKVHLA